MILAAEGPWRLLRRTVARRRWVLLERDLRDPIPSVSAAASVEIGQCALNPDTYLAIRPEADPESVRLALDAAQWGFGAWLDGRLVHLSFAASAPAPWLESLGGPFPVGEDEVVVFETHTSPDVRGKGVSTAVRSEILRFFQAAGYHRMLAFTLPHNAASLRSLDKAGYRRIGAIGWVRIGGWWLNFVRTQPEASPPAGRSGHLARLRLYRRG